MSPTGKDRGIGRSSGGCWRGAGGCGEGGPGDQDKACGEDGGEEEGGEGGEGREGETEEGQGVHRGAVQREDRTAAEDGGPCQDVRWSCLQNLQTPSE